MARVFRGALLAALLLAGGLVAQSFLGSVVGNVRDPAGAVIPGVQVELSDLAKGIQRVVTTSADGTYVFPDLLPGNYVVAVTAIGFQQVRSGEINVLAARTTRFDADLVVGSTKTTVNVEALAPTINTENAEIGDVRPGKDMTTLPMQRGNLQFMFLTAGVVEGDGNMLGGLKGTFTNFTIDGVSGNNSLWGGQSGPTMNDQSIESVREVKVNESNNSAEYPSVANMMVATKSGGNQVHGSAFYLQDNARLDSTPFFSSAGMKGPELHWVGGSAGGPVYLPRIYNGKNKSFFFTTFERRIWPLAAGNIWAAGAIVPLPAFKNGDFSSIADRYPIRDLQGTPYPNNTIPAAEISPVSKFLQGVFPDPTNPAVGISQNNWNGTAARPEHADRYDIRGDHYLGSRDQISARFTHQYDPMPVNPGGFLGVNLLGGSETSLGSSKVRTINQGFLSETHTFSANLINEFRLGYAGDKLNQVGDDLGTDIMSKAGMQGLQMIPGRHGFPDLMFQQSGIAETYETNPRIQVSSKWELIDNVSIQRGAHGLKTGIMIGYGRPHQTQSANTFGQYRFTGFATGLDYADFLLGVPARTRRYEDPADQYPRPLSTGLFFTDAWNATPKLTLNLGLRWEYFAPVVDNNDRRFAFDPATGGLVVPNAQSLSQVAATWPTDLRPAVGTPGFPGRAMMYGDKSDFGPRVSFAYRFNDRTVLRSGYGVYYAEIFGPMRDNFYNGPFGVQQNYYNSIVGGAPQFRFPDPFGVPTPGLADGSLGITATDTHLRMPRTQQWSLAFERQIGQGLVARAAYRGFMSNRLTYQRDLNQPVANTGDHVNDKVYPKWDTVMYTGNGGIQKMNALDLTVERKYTQGVSFQLNYTLASDRSDVGDGDNPTIEYSRDRAREMGNIKYVPRQRMTGNLIWDLPVGKGKRFGSTLPAAASAILGNWELAIVGMMQSGQFLTPVYYGNQANLRATTELIGDCAGSWSVSNPSRDGWFDTSAFTIPAVGQLGNCHRGSVVGPGKMMANVAIHKYFQLAEKVRLKIEANAANAFNHLNLDNPTMNIGAGDFGRIGDASGGNNALQPTVVSTNGERHVFLQARIEF